MARLSATECLVAGQVAQGYSNKEIAAVFGKTEATIKNQVSSTLRKLRLQSRAQLIVFVLG